MQNLFENINDIFDIIVTNPPYIKTDEISILSKEVQNEPTLALDGGQDGLVFYRQIIKQANDYLKHNGYLCMEIGEDQKEEVLEYLTEYRTNKEIPIWISDYVLITYGTGAIMAVPAHDTRDYEFAKKFNLPIVQVVDGENVDLSKEAFTDVATGKLINSDFLNGLEVKDAKKTVIEYLEKNKIGTKKVNYKLRDWVFSRQRYWGEPIPMVYCEDCGWVPLDEKDLPLKLPEVEEFTPGENGESPLAKQTDWINTTCPHCGTCKKRDRYNASMGWFFLVFLKIYGPT